MEKKLSPKKDGKEMTKKHTKKDEKKEMKHDKKMMGNEVLKDKMKKKDTKY